MAEGTMLRRLELSRAARAALLLVAIVVAYAPALRAGFVFDDEGLLSASRSLSGIWLGRSVPDYLPLTWSTFWAESRIWGTWAAGYHGTNLLLHALVALLLWRTLAALRIPGAYLAALLFALHPVAVESVAWVSERKNTLSAVFFLASALAWVAFERTSRTRWWSAALALFACALLAKSSVVMLPIVLLGISAAERGRLTRRASIAVVPFFVLALGAGLVTVHFQRTRALGAAPLPARGLLERAADSAWALASYAGDAFAPVHLAFLPAERPAYASPAFWGPVVAFAAVVAGALLWRSAARRAVATALAYHAIMLAPVLGMVDIAWFRHAPRSNHLQYLALMGPAALIGYGLSQLPRREHLLWAGAVAALMGALGAVTFDRAGAFRDETTLWERAAADAPQSAMAHYMFARQLLRDGRIPDAMAQLTAMAATARNGALARRGRALLGLYAGRPAEAVAEAMAADAEQPDRGYQLALARELVRRGYAAEAMPILSALVSASPAEPSFRYWLGAALVRLGRTSQAADVLTEGLRLDPGDEQLSAALDAIRGRLR